MFCIALVIRKMLYTHHTVKSVINKVLGLVSNGRNYSPLRNYKSHTKNENPTCMIVKHVIGECNDHHFAFKYLGFLLLMF